MAVFNMLDVFYPVGSVYVSYSDSSPATSLGGSWEQVSNGLSYIGTDGVSAPPRIFQGTKSLTSWFQASSAGRYYAYVLSNSEVQEMLGRSFNQDTDYFSCTSTTKARSAYVQVCTYDNNALLAYVNANPTSMTVSWVLVAKDDTPVYSWKRVS